MQPFLDSPKTEPNHRFETAETPGTAGQEDRINGR